MINKLIVGRGTLSSRIIKQFRNKIFKRAGQATYREANLLIVGNHQTSTTKPENDK